MRRALLWLALLVAPALAAACGSAGHASGTTGATNATAAVSAVATSPGIGVKLSEWETAHPAGIASCRPTCYGKTVKTGPTESAYEFTTLTTGSGHRVTGYTQSLGEGVPLATAQARIRALLPVDATTVSLHVEHQGRASCALWNVHSATLARSFAAAPKNTASRGTVLVVLDTLNTFGEPQYEPAKVGEAHVSVATSPQRPRC